MGLFSSLKKLIFSAESVAKHQTSKAIEKGEEVFDEAIDKGSEMLEKAIDKTSELSKEPMEQLTHMGKKAAVGAKKLSSDLQSKIDEWADELNENPKPNSETTNTPEKSPVMEDDLVPSMPQPETKAENLSEQINEEKHFVENVGEQVMDKGNELADALGEKTIEVGQKVMSEGEKLKDSLGEIAKNASESFAAKGNDLLDKAKDLANNPDETIDSISTKIKEVGDAIEAKVKHQDTKFSDKVGYDEHKGSLLDDKDDFFTKAKMFADGNYSMEEKPENKEPESPLELPSEDQFDDVKGYEDDEKK